MGRPLTSEMRELLGERIQEPMRAPMRDFVLQPEPNRQLSRTLKTSKGTEDLGKKKMMSGKLKKKRASKAEAEDDEDEDEDEGEEDEEDEEDKAPRKKEAKLVKP